MSETSNITVLLNQTDWIQGLARSLVRDPDQAADAAQEAWVTALERSPETDRPIRGWLATVLRHRIGRERRRDANRRQREQETARHERTPSTFDLVAKATRSKDLVQAVLELHEPYRETILLRFFEDLSYREIAQRTGTASATVNSRITRGLGQLRERLDGRYGDRQTWLTAFAPFYPTAQSATTLGPGAFTMTTVTQISLLVAASSTALVASWQFSPSEHSVVHESANQPAPPTSTANVALALPVEFGLEAGDHGQVVEQPSDLLSSEPFSAAIADTWELDLSAEHLLGANVRKLSVTSGAGDVEIRPTDGSHVRIEAKLRANLKRADSRLLTSNFADHVELRDDEGSLGIHDVHSLRKDEGWQVTLTVFVPRAMSVHAASGAGDVLVAYGTGDLSLTSGAGDVELLIPDQAAHTVKATSGAGDVLVKIGSVETSLQGTSGAGDVEVHLDRIEGALNAEMSSGAGDVDLTLPKNVAGHFDLQSDVGSVSIPASFGLAIERDVVGAKAHGEIGSGGGNFEMKTSAGSISIELR